MAKNPLALAPVQDEGRVEDLILWEVEPRYCRTAVGLPAGDYEIGEVLLNETASTISGHGAQASFSDVLCIENIVIPNGETREVAALVRGPALVNLDAVVRATAEETDADLITRLADLIAQGVRFVREPAIQSTPSLG